MAAWLVHLRVAERLKELCGVTEESDYYVGALAPDSGRMVGAFEYIPSKDVSHWKTDGVGYAERFALNDGFADKDLFRERDEKKRCFFLGYYIHILTDTLYVRDVIHPAVRVCGREKWRANIDRIRANWYDIDFRFLAGHPGFRPLEAIGSVKEYPNESLDYFTRDDITERVLFVARLYKTGVPAAEPDFFHVTPVDIAQFVASAADSIALRLKEKGIIRNNNA